MMRQEEGARIVCRGDRCFNSLAPGGLETSVCASISAHRGLDEVSYSPDSGSAWARW